MGTAEKIMTSIGDLAMWVDNLKSTFLNRKTLLGLHGSTEVSGDRIVLPGCYLKKSTE